MDFPGQFIRFVNTVSADFKSNCKLLQYCQIHILVIPIRLQLELPGQLREHILRIKTVSVEISKRLFIQDRFQINL